MDDNMLLKTISDSSDAGAKQTAAAGFSSKKLYRIACAAMSTAYTPYSNYNVGAALLAANEEGDLKVFTGGNVENASFGATICAERTAAVKAVTAGYRKFRKIAITATGEEASPCGICRQFLSEFSDSLMVITGPSEDEIHETSLAALLPGSFSFEQGKK